MQASYGCNDVRVRKISRMSGKLKIGAGKDSFRATRAEPSPTALMKGNGRAIPSPDTSFFKGLSEAGFENGGSV